MAVFRLTESAGNDLYDIWCYSYKMWGVEQAESYTTELKACCQNIADNQCMGRIAYEVGRNVRVYHFCYHYIFYVADGSDIVIIAFLHEQMDMLAHIKGRHIQN